MIIFFAAVGFWEHLLHHSIVKEQEKHDQLPQVKQITPQHTNTHWPKHQQNDC